MKKRKTSMNMESSTLAQHLIMGPPKISRVQQLYRQKTKAIQKQMKQRALPPLHISNIQKSQRKLDEEVKNIPQRSQVTVQKQQLENKPITSNNPPVNNENIASTSKIGNVQVVKPSVANSNSTKAQSGNIVTTGEISTKSIKICPARKVITTTSRTQNQSQKLIIVSNAQVNTTSSILQRTLTIPFKTISMKNLDKLKVINTTSAQTVISTTNTTPGQKPKLLTVHTKMKSNTAGKPINIPFIQGVQLQALQNKGAIKMVPLSTTSKISSKSGLVNTSGSVYIMNSNAISAVTPSNSSPIMTIKPQETDTQRNVLIIKNEDLKSPITNENQNVVLLNVQPQKEQKSSVLSDILKASGVIPDEPETSDIDLKQDQCDIESEISQLTEIPINEIDNTRMLTNILEENIEVKTTNMESKESLTPVQELCVDVQEIQGYDMQEIAAGEMQVIEHTEETIENTEVELVENLQHEQEFVQLENVDEVATVLESNVEESGYVILGK